LLAETTSASPDTGVAYPVSIRASEESCRRKVVEVSKIELNAERGCGGVARGAGLKSLPRIHPEMLDGWSTANFWKVAVMVREWATEPVAAVVMLEWFFQFVFAR
jgi:hypothetical protein